MRLEISTFVPPIFRKCNCINEFSKSLVVQRGLNNFLKLGPARCLFCVMDRFYGYLTNLKGLKRMISGKNIHKKYGAVEVLKGVDIDIKKGEVASIVGPSGSGKSTLLHILGTLDKADMGAVNMHETPIHLLAGKKLAAFRNKHIGFVFQFHHLLPEFNAWENVCIPGWLAGRKKNEVKDEALQLLTLLGLEHRIENKPNELSGGEQQRVAVARALINRPDIVMADEPTGNLDSTNARELHDLFFNLREKFNQTFLIVTHNEELARLSDRVLHMKDGKIVS
jgi:lipoprotein-releasing system ATP-binding protein